MRHGRDGSRMTRLGQVCGHVCEKGGLGLGVNGVDRSGGNKE